MNSCQLQHLCLESKKISTINSPLDQTFLDFGYSTTYDLFYFSTRETNDFVLFDLKQQQIEIKRRHKLIDKRKFLIKVHVYENLVFFLYLSSLPPTLGKYDLENSSYLQSFSFENHLYDDEEQSSYEIIDFVINNFHIYLLVRFKNKSKFKIVVHDYADMTRLHSFDLIDAIKPKIFISVKR